MARQRRKGERGICTITVDSCVPMNFAIDAEKVGSCPQTFVSQTHVSKVDGDGFAIAKAADNFDRVE